MPTELVQNVILASWLLCLPVILAAERSRAARTGVCAESVKGRREGTQ